MAKAAKTDELVVSLGARIYRVVDADREFLVVATSFGAACDTWRAYLVEFDDVTADEAEDEEPESVELLTGHTQAVLSTKHILASIADERVP